MSDKKITSRISSISLKQWTAISLCVVALIFILQNLNIVRVELLFFHTTSPLWAVLLITLLLGYLIGRFSKKQD